MSDILLDTQSAPTTPASGKAIIYVDVTSEKLMCMGDDGVARMAPALTNANTADVIANAADTYLTGSSLAVPTSLRAGSIFNWRLAMSKTNAGTVAPIFNIRYGTTGTVGSDTARLVFTMGSNQSAAIDNGVVDITAVCRVVDSSVGAFAGVLTLQHLTGGTDTVAAGGLATITTDIKQATSASFNNTVANSIIGVSVNPGASAIWTFQLVSVWAFNI